MPTYSFLSMLASLSIQDTPLSYTPPVGPKVETTLRYSEMEANQPAVFGAFNVGPKWTLNWRSYIQDDPAHPGSRVLRYLAGGGGRTYTGYNSTTHQFAPESDNGAALIRVSADPIRYELRYGDGSIEVFSLSDGQTTYPRKVFLTEIIDPQGNALTLSYDAQRRLVSVTDTIGQVTTFEYADAAAPLRVTAVQDPFGRRTDIGYDDEGRLTSITDAIGMTSTFTYDSGTFITAMTTPYGTTTFKKTVGVGDRRERSIEATDPEGYTERTEYRDLAPGMTFSESEAPQGMRTNNRYLQYRNSFYWDKNAFADACTIGSNGVTSCNYRKARIKHFLHKSPCCSTTSRILESIKYPLENRTWFDYAGQNGFAGRTGIFDQPTHIGRILDDGSSQVTTLSYNSFGRITKRIDPDGRETDYVYDSNGIDLLEVRRKTASGYDTLEQYSYNDQHRPLTYTDAAGQTTTYTYNARGQRTSETDALGRTTRYDYDANGYLTQVINALGHVQSRYTYDPTGRLASETDSEGYTATYTYDALNRLTRTGFPDGTSRQYGWDRLDLHTVTDREDRMTRMDYDAERRLVTTTDPLGRTLQYGHDATGYLTSFTDANGNTTQWARDLEGRVTAKTYADGQGDRYTYDKASRLLTATDALGQVRRRHYSAADLLTGISYEHTIHPTPDVSFSYDPAYPRRTRMTDGLGTTTFDYVAVGMPGALQLASSDGPYGSNDTVEYSYDVLGRLVGRDTGIVASYQYDALDRLSSETNPLGSFAYGYLGDTDQLATQNLTLPDGKPGQALSVVYDHNDQDRQLRRLDYRAARSNRVMAMLTYTHTVEHLVGSRESLTLEQHGMRHDEQRYDYDAADRLIGVRDPGQQPTSTYDYDDADNLLHKQAPSQTLDASANALNQLDTVNGQPYQYDAAGDLINDGQRQYDWDAAHRLIGITDLATGDTTTMAYDGLGRRLSITDTDSTGTTIEARYLWCGNEICQKRDSNDTITAAYFPQGEWHAGQPIYTVRDALGSVVMVSDGKGNLLGTRHYSPYGLTDEHWGQSADFGYAGMLRHSPTGLYLTKYRAYQPALGRWLSRDPIGIEGGINIYAYIGGQPTGSIDPLGLVGETACARIGGGKICEALVKEFCKYGMQSYACCAIGRDECMMKSDGDPTQLAKCQTEYQGCMMHKPKKPVLPVPKAPFNN